MDGKERSIKMGKAKQIGYIHKGIRMKESLYKKVLSKLHQREEPRGFVGWLEKKMLNELMDDLDWLDYQG